ncbi:MAG: cytochrome P450 [Proteobacteria bacterium]|nr:cytochrome P450 [Pseudomonadota bacterium]
MTNYPAPYADAPCADIDPYELRHLLDGHEFHQILKNQAPLVWLTHYGVWATGRHPELTAIFKDHATFCSSRGVGLQDFKKEKPWRAPSLILEVDPPEHTATRKILSSVLSNQALAGLRPAFELEADRLVRQLLDQGEIDGISDLAIAYPGTVFPQAVGLTASDNTPLLEYGTLVFNMLGPANEISAAAGRNAATVLPWIADQCARHNLAPGGLGRAIYAYVDAGEITEEEASLLVRSLLSAGLDTTVIALGNALHSLAKNPQQWQALRAHPEKARSAFEEVLRFESPIHTFYRTAARATEVSGIRIGEGDKILLNIQCANRDTQRWPDADTFDISRKPGGHAAFGAGIHACVGRHLATLEAEILLKSMASMIEKIDLIGEPVRQPNNTLTGYKTLPLRLS